MTDEKPKAGEKLESKSLPDQVAGWIVAAMIAGGGAGTFWSLLKEKPNLPIAALSATITLGAGYVGKTMQDVHKRNAAQAERLGKKLGETQEIVFAQLSGFEGKYLEALKAYCKQLKVEGFKGNLPTVPLEKVYVPLRMQSGEQHNRQTDIWHLLPKPDDPKRDHRFAITADPGFGKTTLTRYLTLKYSQREQPKEMRVLIPVLLLLRSMYKQVQDERSPNLFELIANTIKRDLPGCQDLQESQQWFRENLRKGNCLVMLDGLDEVPEDQREKVSRWINWQMQNYETPFILTSRPHGYDSTLFDGVRQIGIAEFNRQQKSDFIHNWYRARIEEDWRLLWEDEQSEPEENRLSKQSIVAQCEKEASENATELINQLVQNEAMNQLANNPLLVTIIAATHRITETLPNRRVKLYQEIFDLMLERRPNRRETKLTLPDAEENQAVLQALAVKLTEQNITEFTLEQSAPWIQSKLSEYCADGSLTPKKFLKEIQNVAGVLAGSEANLYQFTHKTFQEYLAAVELKRLNQEQFLITQFLDENWKEVVCFYAAMTNATRFVQLALREQSDYALTLARRMVIDEKSKVGVGLREQLTQVLAERNIGGELGAKVRLEARVLEFISITDTISIDPEYITWSEYLSFLESQKNGQFHSQARIDLVPPADLNQPVTGISRSDAEWFCAWLSTQTSLQAEGKVFEYRLPTESELQQVSEKLGLIAWTDSPQREGNALRVVRVQLPERYETLLNYLANGRWEEADRETTTLMQEIAGREGTYLRIKDIQNFPCEDLRILDQLWVRFSGGRFGFSVQKQIYVETGNPLDGRYYEETFGKFCDRVQWMKSGKYMMYSGVIFYTSAPRGHLPFRHLPLTLLGGLCVSLLSRGDL